MLSPHFSSNKDIGDKNACASIKGIEITITQTKNEQARDLLKRFISGKMKTN